MIAIATELLRFLQKPDKYAIPIYQRTYSWGRPQCQQLWDDIMSVGERDDVKEHFIGSIVYVNEHGNVSKPKPHSLIDGQQRLTTVALILEALARKSLQAMDESAPTYNFTDAKIRKRYLLDDLEQGESRYKLFLTKTDKDTLLALLDRRELPVRSSIRVRDNFDFFMRCLKRLDMDGLTQLCAGLGKLTIVDVSLERGKDNPQRIFESMNSTGKDLSKADLIRNFILMDRDPEIQTDLYERYWWPMEQEFGRDEHGKFDDKHFNDKYFDDFMRCYLSLKIGTIPTKKAVYEKFKVYKQERENAGINMDEFVEGIYKFAKYYCSMALNGERDYVLTSGFNEIRELRTESAYPLLLKLYDDYKNELLNRDDFSNLIRLIRNYVLRRDVCGLDKKALSQTFVKLARGMDERGHLESVKEHFLKMERHSSQRFPDDEEFGDNLIRADLYHTKICKYLLSHLENHGRKERVGVDQYTIEHIMPQTKHLSRGWKDALGPQWELVQQKWLHTLGNLTLTGYNPEYGNKPFPEKRDMEGGFRESPLHLNEGLGQVDEWNEAAIKDRGERLARQAMTIWDRPTLP